MLRIAILDDDTIGIATHEVNSQARAVFADC
jgi:hypothetical protein